MSTQNAREGRSNCRWLEDPRVHHAQTHGKRLSRGQRANASINAATEQALCTACQDPQHVLRQMTFSCDDLQRKMVSWNRALSDSQHCQKVGWMGWKAIPCCKVKEQGRRRDWTAAYPDYLRLLHVNALRVARRQNEILSSFLVDGCNKEIKNLCP